MNRKDDSTSFGSYLRKHRQKRGISLKDIADATKINVNSLLLLEREELDKLPPDVIVRGFIKAYSSFIGLDSSEPLKRYECHCKKHSLLLEPENQYDKNRTTSLRLHRQMGITIACFFLLVVCVVSFQKYFSKDMIKPDTPQQMVRPPTAAPEQTLQKSQLRGTEAESRVVSRPEETQEKHRLNILTIQRTWIRITIDDRETMEYLLTPKDRLTKKAADKFELLIGNAAGVILNFDGRELGPLGKPGQVVRITLP